MPDYAAQGIVHGLLALACVSAFLALTQLDRPDQRLRARLLALAVAVLLSPALVFLLPGRAREDFREERALFATQRLRDIRLAGLGADGWLLGGLALLGGALFLRDLLPFLAERLPVGARRWPTAPADEALRAEADRLAAQLGAPASGCLRVVDSPALALFCTGLRRPSVVVSRGTLEQLDAAELRAALAHELAHLAQRDPSLGWVLMLLRAIQAYNPAVQVLARSAAGEMERRADDLAARATGDRLALAAGLLKAFRRVPAQPAPASARSVPGLAGALGLWQSLRAGALEERCRRLLRPAPVRELRQEGLHLAALGIGLGVLLFFVV